jgi:hypothetical protein
MTAWRKAHGLIRVEPMDEELRIIGIMLVRALSEKGE